MLGHSAGKHVGIVDEHGVTTVLGALAWVLTSSASTALDKWLSNLLALVDPTR